VYYENGQIVSLSPKGALKAGAPNKLREEIDANVNKYMKYKK
jgi:hypothetical protein